MATRDSKGRFKKKDERDTIDQLTSADYFTILKSKKQKATDVVLSDIYNNCLVLFDKYERTGQLDAMKKVMFHISTIEKERKLIELGFTDFVYKKDIEYYIENVTNKNVKVIELNRFERGIPDDVIARYEQVKNIFDEFYVVFTDFTNEHTKKTMKERDPILFGVFRDSHVEALSERFYFIGDWVDEYCDLTLDKLVSELHTDDPEREAIFKLRDPVTLDELKEKVKALEQEKVSGMMISPMYSLSLVQTTSSTNPAFPAPPPMEPVVEKGEVTEEKSVEDKTKTSIAGFFKKLFNFKK